ncbi:histidine kinase [Pseudomonas oryzihabitans]|uniref:histidine kinase n=1 Tax=Pseudomonas oryzihabitans TaxID=47885 RepID=A0A0U4WQB2_9PSED|nr:HAMP domain-containing sensor histidine kinase [Pseudomonas oryzihabitans]ALZ84915.1 histidine kinase [Pseudomonas oryzihabitans]
MSSSPRTRRWRSGSSRLLALYALFFAAWGAVFTGVLYWQISNYLGAVAERTLLQRAHYYRKVADRDLLGELQASEVFSMPGIDAYGLFEADGRYIAGNLVKLLRNLPDDGQVHYLQRGLRTTDALDETRSSHAFLQRRADGRILVLARDGGSISAVGGIIGQALFWGLSLTLIPGLVGWHLLRRRPLRRVERLQRSLERIVAGHLEERLPLSSRHDELDMLADAVNTTLAQLERSMHEVKGVCDGIAHDLRTPLTRLRARLHQLQQLPLAAPQADSLGEALAETEAIMSRFQGLLRISELEDTRRRMAFAPLDLAALLRQAHDFYEPLAQEKAQTLSLELGEALPEVQGDAELLFEALVNLLDNALKFAPEGGQVRLVARGVGTAVRIEVIDDGPGIPEAERESVLRRLYRGDASRQQPGYGLGLSLVAAIVRLHGFHLSIAAAEPVGARVVIATAD